MIEHARQLLLDHPGMLPQFPNFKRLELSDGADIRSYTSQFAPFSDFNFGSLWAWDVRDRTEISQLHQNLIVRFEHFVSELPFYSFIGCNVLGRTASSLIERADAEGLEPRLELVPESTAAHFGTDTLRCEEDVDESDYVLGVERLQSYSGPEFSAKRGEVRKFLRSAGECQVKRLDLADAATVRQLKDLFERWYREKPTASPLRFDREFRAFERCLVAAPVLRLVGVGVFIGRTLAAFSISELTSASYACTYFEKTDAIGFPGIGAFLNQQVANVLAEVGVKYINIEQDLGIPGLRQSKRSYGPVGYLRKFQVRQRELQVSNMPMPAAQRLPLVTTSVKAP